jgi:antitoxin component of RelBE/YafQ-DinJ toxin-antitoxin module
MIAIIQDAETLRSVGPIEFSAYLRSRAWQQIEQIGDRGTVWTKQASKDEDYEILLPLDRTSSEYARRVSEALQTLAVAEERDEIQVLRDITMTTSDVVRVRLQHGLIEHGTIPFEYGVQMVKEVRDALLAAACATVSPRALYQSRIPQEAMAYVNGLRMGQTEEGSFVLAIQSHVTPALRPANLFPELSETRDDEPFERRVLLRLSEALAAIKQAIVSAGATSDFKPFQDAVAQGVSANLCAALVGLSMDNTAEDVAFDISWSPTRLVTEKLPTRFRFGRDTFPVLREAARLLRESAPIEEFALLGTVTSLHRDETSTSGRITVSALIGKDWRKVRMALSDRDYQTAVKAHSDKEFVIGIGELVRQRRGYDLLNVRDFAILDYPEPDDDFRDEPAEADPFADD